MTVEIPQYGLKAYALFFSRHGITERFGQQDLDWIVSNGMKKKIFSLLLHSGWIVRKARNSYVCVAPEKAVKGLLDFRMPEVISKSERPYAFTGLSAIEIWSDYSYVQRGWERSPYFIRILRKDLPYWKDLFSRNGIPTYVRSGTTIGEYVILEPVGSIDAVKKGGFSVIRLKEAEKQAKSNSMFAYAYDYMRKKYGSTAT